TPQSNYSQSYNSHTLCVLPFKENVPILNVIKHFQCWTRLKGKIFMSSTHSSSSVSALQKELEDLKRKIAEAEKSEPSHVHALRKREREVTEEISRISDV
ncbi:hypothetical protein, partial [Acetobacter sp.]|uniref:hypothetical protein n=1 Tax=Acetobacter sp. TaxID=440 RepID=UPI0039E93C45